MTHEEDAFTPEELNLIYIGLDLLRDSKREMYGQDSPYVQRVRDLMEKVMRVWP